MTYVVTLVADVGVESTSLVLLTNHLAVLVADGVLLAGYPANDTHPSCKE